MNLIKNKQTINARALRKTFDCRLFVQFSLDRTLLIAECDFVSYLYMLFIKFVSRLQTTLHSVTVRELNQEQGTVLVKLTKSSRRPKRSADSGFTFEPLVSTLFYTVGYSMILSCSFFVCIVLYIYFIVIESSTL